MNTTPESTTETSQGASMKRDLQAQLLNESEAMMRYALASGMRVPGEVGQQLSSVMSFSEPLDPAGSAQPADPKQLIDIHNKLAALVAPATARSILYAAQAESRVFGKFGAIPLLRQLWLISGIALVVLVGTKTSRFVGSGTPGSMAAENAVGIVVVMNQLFFLSAATLGACFFALFKAQGYVAKRTFDPLYIPVYWTRIVLGVLAGIILANFLAIDSLIGLVPDHLERVSVSLLGGFSADAVFGILVRMVETLNTLVRGTGAEVVAAEKQRFQSRLDQEGDLHKLKRANELISLRNKLASGGDVKELEGIVSQLIEKNLNH